MNGASMQGPIVQLTGVKKIYRLGASRIHALNGVNLSIERGDFVTIMGSSGSGKSTMLNLIGCLDQPTEGTVKINGTDLSLLNDDQLTEIRQKQYRIHISAVQPNTYSHCHREQV